MYVDTQRVGDRPLRLRRNRPVNLGIGRIILTGLTHLDGDHYTGAEIVIAAPEHPVSVHNLRIGEAFDLDGRWILHTVLIAENEPAVDIIRNRSAARLARER